MINKSGLVKINFYLLLLMIGIFGIILRFIDYDKVPPFGETRDEFMYPWAGISWLTEGTPSSWSNFPSYKEGNYISFNNVDFRIVSPWLEKPPLYPLITGLFEIINGEISFEEVKLSTLRIVPLLLSFITMISIGFLVKETLNESIAIIATLLYATIPTIVMANRLSLTENLLTPIIILTLFLFVKNLKAESKTKTLLIILGCVLALLTKNIAFVLPLSLILIYIVQKKYKASLIIAIPSLLAALIHPLIGYFYDWDLFVSVMNQYKIAHAIGLPELVSTIFRFPVIGHKENIFQDGSILAGYILIFSSPFWFKKANGEDLTEKQIIIIFPLLFLAFMNLLEGGQTFFGWHFFPIYPFMVILIAKVFYDLFQKPNLIEFTFIFLVIISSSVRFLLILLPNLVNSWMTILGLILAISLLLFLFNKTKYTRLFLTIVFLFYLLINTLTVINLKDIYKINYIPIRSSNTSHLTL